MPLELENGHADMIHHWVLDQYAGVIPCQTHLALTPVLEVVGLRSPRGELFSAAYALNQPHPPVASAHAAQLGTAANTQTAWVSIDGRAPKSVYGECGRAGTSSQILRM